MKLEPLLVDGLVMAVLRPQDPALALNTAMKIVEDQNLGLITREQASGRMNDMLSIQEYTYLGLLGPKQEILSAHGEVLGQMLPGDSFVPYDQLMAVMGAVDAEKTAKEN